MSKIARRSHDYLVEISVVDVVLFAVVGILLLDVVGEKVVVDPIPNLLRWDVVVETSCVVVADLAVVDVEVVVVVGALFSLSIVAVGLLKLLFSSVSSMLMKNSLLSMSMLSLKLST